MNTPLPKTEILLALLMLLFVSSTATAQGANGYPANRLVRWLDNRGRSVAQGRGEYREAQARYLDSSRRFVEGAHSGNSTVEAPEPAP